MTDTFATANDAILGRFLAKWTDGEALTAAGYLPVVYWPGQDEQAPDWSKHWLRVSIQRVEEGQSTISTCIGEIGKRRYRVHGLVFVQVFSPKDNTGFEVGGKLATIAKTAFRGKTAGASIWFRNARVQELPPEVDAHRFNVVTEFEYDEVN